MPSATSRRATVGGRISNVPSHSFASKSKNARNLQNYNVLFHSLLYTTATEDYQRQRIVGQSTSTAAPMAYNAAAPVVREHVIASWLGFLGSSKPSFIDTSLLGNVRITITLNLPRPTPPYS